MYYIPFKLVERKKQSVYGSIPLFQTSQDYLIEQIFTKYNTELESSGFPFNLSQVFVVSVTTTNSFITAKSLALTSTPINTLYIS